MIVPEAAPFEGHVWITGASSGIGRELARRVARTAAHVSVSARSLDKLRSLADECRNISAHPVDVADADAVRGVLEQIRSGHGDIDTAILNAGIWRLMDAVDLDADFARAAMLVNYLGVVNALSVLIPAMRARGRGHIVIVASVAGYRGLPKSISYGPTKAALINLAETLRCELEPLGIRVTLVNPGFVDTPMTQSNPFPMPGIVSADAAAATILEGLRARRYEIVFPTWFAAAMKILRIVPNGAYFWLVRTFVHKPSQ